MDTEDSVEDDGGEFVVQADKLASTIARSTTWSRFIIHNLHFVYFNESFCLVNVVRLVFVTAFLKKSLKSCRFWTIQQKSAHTFVNNYKFVSKDSAD